MQTQVTKKEIFVVSQGMAEMAAKYPNHIISNALSRVSQKLESFGTLFSQTLTKVDKDTIRFYHQHK